MSKKNGRFRVPHETCVLVLADYNGAEVRCRLDVGFGMYLAISKVDGEDKSRAIEACRRFGDEVIVEWNLEDNGEPLPATGEAFLTLPSSLELAMIKAWSEAMGASTPLVETS